jgi:hypothetical protein
MVSVLMVNPSGIKKLQMFAIIETGMASTGISVARQLCKNKKYNHRYQPQRFQQCLPPLHVIENLYYRYAFKRHYIIYIFLEKIFSGFSNGGIDTLRHVLRIAARVPGTASR